MQRKDPTPTPPRRGGAFENNVLLDTYSNVGSLKRKLK